MVTGNEFVVLDVFWDKELNGGTISEVDPVYDGVAYWWKCFGCGNSFQNTLCRELWDFRAVKTSPMDNVCPHCNYSGVTSGLSVLDMLNKVDLDIKEEVDSLYSEFIKKSSTGKTFITKCPVRYFR